MKRVLPVLAVLLLAAAVVTTLAAPPPAETAERWLHVRVEKTGEKGESVRVNIPLRVAEKVLPAIHVDVLQAGKVRTDRFHRGHEIDLRALLEAVRELDDGVFVTIQEEDGLVRVAKEKGYLLVKVDEKGAKGERVDVKVPFSIIEALLSGGKDELNLLAAIQALNEHGDNVFVTIHSRDESVRVWVDSKSTTE